VYLLYLSLDNGKLLKPLYSGLRKVIQKTTFLSAKLPLPPLPEQTAIVRFINYVDQRIRRYIRAKRKLIKLLEEQKQAIIHQAVTGQIDVRTGKPYPSYKSSGIEWLGDVPEHWEVLRGKHIGRLFSTPSVSDENLTSPGDDLPMYLKVSDLGKVDAELRLDASALYVRGSAETAVKTVESCVVFPKRGGAIYTNKVAIVSGRFLLDPNLMGWALRSGFDSRYVALLLKTRTLSDLADVSSVPQINNKHIGPIFFPAPSLQEQRAILVYLSEVTTNLEAGIIRANREIELLNEYSTRLIADVITGKLDVRGYNVVEQSDTTPEGG
jgi:type I restriction enzyme S subunit